MVGPGEVDEDLEPETAEECAKYGKVIRCVIFEIPAAVDTEAVRIFLEFERVESAIKGKLDLKIN
jgi:splicing factor 45